MAGSNTVSVFASPAPHIYEADFAREPEQIRKRLHAQVRHMEPLSVSGFAAAVKSTNSVCAYALDMIACLELMVTRSHLGCRRSCRSRRVIF